MAKMVRSLSIQSSRDILRYSLYEYLKPGSGGFILDPKLVTWLNRHCKHYQCDCKGSLWESDDWIPSYDFHIKFTDKNEEMLFKLTWK